MPCAYARVLYVLRHVCHKVTILDHIPDVHKVRVRFHSIFKNKTERHQSAGENVHDADTQFAVAAAVVRFYRH